MPAKVIALAVAGVLVAALLAVVVSSCWAMPVWVGAIGLRVVQVMTPIALLVAVALVVRRGH